MQPIKTRSIWVGLIALIAVLILTTGLAVYHSGQIDEGENAGLVLVSAECP